MRTTLLVLTALSALIGCDSDATTPPLTGEVRIAHAAAGAGAVGVTLDGRLLTTSLEPGEAIGDSVPDGAHSVEFDAGGARTTVALRTFGALMGVVLMGDQAPTPRLYPHTVSGGGGAHIKIINAVPDRRLGVSLAGGSIGVGTTLDYTASSDFGAQPARYAVRVHEDDPEEAVDLGTVLLPEGRSFVVIRPAAEGDGSLDVLVF